MGRKRKSRFATKYRPKEDGISQSLLGAWLACRQRAEYQLQGWKAKGDTKASLIFGDRFHQCLDWLYDGGRLEPEYEHWFVEWEQECQSESALIELTKLECVWEGYREYQQSIDRRKFEITYPSLNPGDFWSTEEIFNHYCTRRKFRARGKIDGIAEWNGKWWLVEHKTSSRIQDNDYYVRCAYDHQVLFYFLELKLRHKRPIGVLYNVIRVPQLQFRKDDSYATFRERLSADIASRPDHYFKRFPVEIDSRILNRYAKELRLKVKDFRAWCEGKLPTYRNEGACTGRFNCEFISACASGHMKHYTRDRILFEELQHADRNAKVQTADQTAGSPA
jgi:hypothetical protein